MTPSFLHLGPDEPASPVVISVPHAGRDYPPALLAELKAGLAAARSLEDRHIDAVALAAHGGETLFIQRRARAWIDLNRGEDERDPLAEEGVGPSESRKARDGLGLIPRRGARNEPLWRRRWRADEVTARIASDHRPYHDALARALGAARARFGAAMLLDLHSMPPLIGRKPARIVIGDRFGRAAEDRFTRRIVAIAERAGLRSALNAPYAGGYVLERHAAPRGGMSALQLEIDRSLYLGRALQEPDPAGVARMAALLRAMLLALAEEALTAPLAEAAE